jgi:molybdenum cofactor guanylyltransferase
MSAAAPQSGIAGIVIAGGRSTRFGGEKAVALLDGRPLLEWAASRLQRSCSAVAVNARAGTEAAALAGSLGLPLVHDLPGDAAGPLAGVRAGLAWARDLGAHTLAVSPCDVPLAPDELYTRLLGAAGAGAAMADTADGRQPLCSVWPVSALPLVEQSLADGKHPPLWLTLERIGAVPVRFAQPLDFTNVNTREDLAAVAGRLEHTARPGHRADPSA